MSSLPRDRFVLRWHEAQTRSGPGRRQQLIGMESYLTHQIADLLIRIEQLLVSGYLISVNPPANPPTVDADITPSTCTLDVIAR